MEQNQCNCDELIGELSNVEEGLVGELTNPIEYVYPELEPLHITPSGEKQHFKSDKYGYDEVEVDAVESEVLEIIPTTQDQVYEGLFKKVTVPGEPNLLAENISEGKNIFGVEGVAKTTNLVITDGTYLFDGGHRVDTAQELVDLCGAITSAESMFRQCQTLTELDVSRLDTSQCTNMNNMFYNCRNIQELDVSGWNTSNVTNMNSMFSNCRAITELDVTKWNMSNVTNTYYIFNTCTQLTTLDLSGWDLGKVINCRDMFYNDNNLTSIESFKNLGKGFTATTTNNSNYFFSVTSSSKLILQSLIDLLTNGLYDLNLTYDVANGGTLYTQQCRVGSINLAKLEATEEGLAAIAQANLKGWTVS